MSLTTRIRATAAEFNPALIRVRTDAWIRDRAERGRYRLVDEPALAATKKSATLFVFGSGRSLAELPDASWRHFEAHDTLSFNWFPHQRRVRVDYHVIREVASNDLDAAQWRPALEEYAGLIGGNPRYRDTVFVVQEGWRAVNGNRLIGLGLLPEGARVFRFRNRSRGVPEPPSWSFGQGLVHAVGTLNDCVNFGAILGWSHIVLVGVDLYDNRYFWLDENETRESLIAAGSGLSHRDPFPAAARYVTVFGLWRTALESRGIRLSVLNPKSVLAAVLPVYQVPALGDAQ